jgi:hypothetical protein
MTDLATLTREEAIALHDCEERIERGLKTFLEVGRALALIRDSRLYRETHETFEDYAVQRWSLSRAHAYRMIAAAEVVSPMGDIAEPPTNERQVRELAKVPEAERADVWAETLERTNGKPTAAAVAEVSEEQRKRAEEQRDARALLRLMVDTVARPTWKVADFDVWVKQLGSYDEELAELAKGSADAIAVLDRVIDEVGR